MDKCMDGWMDTVGHLGILSFIYLFLFLIFLTALGSLWDLSSPTGDQTHAPCRRSAES